MAKSWSGFLPQNQEVKEQWGILEESRKQIESRLERLLKPAGDDSQEYEEEEAMCLEPG